MLLPRHYIAQLSYFYPLQAAWQSWHYCSSWKGSSLLQSYFITPHIKCNCSSPWETVPRGFFSFTNHKKGGCVLICSLKTSWSLPATCYLQKLLQCCTQACMGTERVRPAFGTRVCHGFVLSSILSRDISITSSTKFPFHLPSGRAQDIHTV